MITVTSKTIQLPFIQRIKWIPLNLEKLYVLTTTSLDIAGSLETGAFCLAELPELKICPELRLGFPNNQPEGLTSSPPAVEPKNISNG